MKRQAMMMKKTGDEEPKQKERHIVTWTQQEDDILREQIRIHGTENSWTIIASKFKDKTTRQCRRRWYTYLNSDFKKGGWSPEEDMILCEAQKVFGNRWTEIAKVVSGRTDNAVKNRFSTLCKKRAKHEALAKENANSYNKTNKRVLIQNGDNTDITSDIAGSLKRMRRSHIPIYPNSGGNLLGEYGNPVHQQMRSPFSVLVQNFHNVNSLAVHHHVDSVKEASNDAAQSNKIQGTFLRKDDPKIAALMQQAELLSSLAVKVNKENTDQSLENAWKALQDFLDESKESDMPRVKFSDMDFQLEDFKDLVDDLRSNEQGPPSWRQPDLYEESSASSEYSSGSSLLSQTTADKMEQIQTEYCGVQQDTGVGLKTVDPGDQNGFDDCGNGIRSRTSTDQDIFLSCDESGNNEGVVSGISRTEFSSPLQVTPMFRSLAAGIPTPKFSESERHFLLKTLGMESPSTKPSTNSLQPPPCKRALLGSL